MARARNIKPGFYKNEDLAECSIWARYIFPGLWMNASREGILEDRPKRLKAEVLPFDVIDVEPLLAELHERCFIYRYVDESGRRLIFIPGFSTHQSPHYSEKPSGMKPPELPERWRHQANRNLGDTPEQTESSPNVSGVDGGLKRGSQPPDSLIPDSLNPDSRKPPPKKALSSVGDIPRPADSTARAALSPEVIRTGELREIAQRHGVSLNAKAMLHLGQWAREDLTPAQFEQAAIIARKRKPLPAALPITYLVPIVDEVKAGTTSEGMTWDETKAEGLRLIREREEREAREAAAREATAPPATPRARDAEPAAEAEGGALIAEEESALERTWWRDDEGVLAAGMDAAVVPIADEPFSDYAARVMAARGHGPWLDDQDEAMLARIAAFRASGWNPPEPPPQIVDSGTGRRHTAVRVR